MDVRWGIIGTGYVARIFASDLDHAEHGSVVAVASRRADRAGAFAADLAIPAAYRNAEDLIADPAVDAVYVATPHTAHAHWALRAVEAGKPVLCEKPLATDPDQIRQVVDAAQRADVFLMEGFMYRLHPQTELVAELVERGEIGEVRQIRASFANDAEPDPAHRLFDPALGGGAIHDLGCYPMSMARLLAGRAAGLPRAEPEELAGAGHLGPTGVDEAAAALLRFPTGITAQLTTGLTLPAERGLRVDGTGGSILVPDPWSCGRPAEIIAAGELYGTGEIRLVTEAGDETLAVEPDRPLFALEADHVAECLRGGLTQSPLLPWADTLGNGQALHRWRAAIG
ncbi:Gfo/Idh/MocA family oxidoreductase [Streptomyces antimycoticus]|uniref:Gfo/Idh/MocA family protein n=1 Tax=Streptomyces antimycoticus TaxID=68175 RepID=UPI003432CE01